jgi:hypothetical protein
METGASSTSDSTTESESETSTSQTTVVFVPESDHPWNECDSFEQDCPDGEKCVPYASTGGSWDAQKCVPVLGSQSAGEPCTYAGRVESTDDCDATGFCLDTNDEGGTCVPFCTGTADMPECPPKSLCSTGGSGVITLCLPICDPILQDCDEGLVCIWVTNNFQCVFAAQGIPFGEPCGFINDCAAGSGCTSADALPSCAGEACCSPFCQLGAGDLPCEVLPGTTCVPFFEQGMAPPGFEHVGMCLLPP